MKKKDTPFQYNEENNDETIDQIRDVYISGAIEQSEINDEKEQKRTDE
ncbi:hypothetical protein KHA93_09910 [Bacillus sp. FJAT-49732]|uniref:Uncharacterized protein n=1 Tax=Lederbergia citrisecunda TaxID=2833583 RepID=A0A942YN55_9BACI|nr:hypothetical protein [Lederbergia citrisecunda]MBS4199971.1 hypothetical protein [Lederbergia citrisecunda]